MISRHGRSASRRARISTGVLAVAVVILVTSLAPPAAGGAQHRADPSIRWHACHFDRPSSPRVQCGRVRVPLDRSHSGAESISIAVDRLPAVDRERRIGTLMVNPGGPGGSGVRVVAQGGMLLGSPDLKRLRQRFDIVGFDPRGVGGSAPITCDGDLLHDPDVATFPHSRAQYRQLVRNNRAAGRSCEPRRLLPHVDTVSAARDVDAIREALGERTISWLGVSYGSELGQTYAALFPHRVRAMVLDGAVDHARSLRRGAIDEARAIERGFRHFADWCDRQDSCALHGHDVPRLFDRLNRRAGRGQVPATSLHRNVTAEEVTEGMYGYLYLRSLWPRLATALGQAAGIGGRPDGSALVATASFTDPASYAPYRAIGCQDFPSGLHGFADLAGRAALLRAVAPHTWRYSEFWDWTTGCAGWPASASNPPHPTDVTGAPPILVVGNTGDPATPYAWARAVHRQIDGSALLTSTIDGHTGLYNSACARRHEVSYLVSGRTPPTGTRCRN